MSTAGSPSALPVPSDDEVALLLQIVWDLLVDGQHWPSYDRVDRLLYQRHQLDIDGLIARTPVSLLQGGRPQGHAAPLGEGQLSLTVAGAAACEGSQPALDVVVAAARIAASVELGADPAGGSLSLTFEQVLDVAESKLEEGAAVARQSGLLLHSEPWTGHVMLYEGGWQMSVDRRARPFIAVHDLSEYWDQRTAGEAPTTSTEADTSDHVIQLTRRWKIEQQLGSGGFGRVFAATADDGSRAAVKLVPKRPGAARELLFVELDGVRNVVPVLDSGEIDDAYVLVMPLASASLQDRLGDSGEPMPVDDALKALTDVATALVDLEGRGVVHRDIKPANVLLLDGAWCLADFGIARYAEASTAPDTLKLSLSRQYAAPERWRLERATAATDVYAVGVMAFELLTGGRPFRGPDFRDQHLHADPPPMPEVPAQLAALVQACLAKPPQARPGPEALLGRLRRAAGPSLGPGAAALAGAFRKQAERRLSEEAAASRALTEQERRSQLATAARRSLEVTSTTLLAVITDLAPDITVKHRDDGGWHVELGGARFGLSAATPVDPGDWGSPIDVISFATISVAVPGGRFGYEGRNHSLWFCDARREGEYGWFETAFMTIRGIRPQEPFALPPGGEAGGALSPVTTSTQVAWPFTELVTGDVDEFIDRWVGWFAAGVEGKLERPPSMPERSPEGSWRRS